MTKKNIIVLLIMAVLLVGSLLFADVVTFNESKDVAHNLQGYINVYTSNTEHHRATYEPITVTIYLRDSDENEYTHQYLITTNSSGSYWIDFTDVDRNEIYTVSVNFRGNIYYADYDYSADQSIRIDINWWKSF